MATEKNLCGKSRKLDNPYEIWQTPDGSWTWRVLKKWQSPSKEKSNPYARWFCAVSSPHTYGGYDYGDVYVREITQYAIKVFPVGESIVYNVFLPKEA